MFSSEFSSVVEDYISHEKVSEENKVDLKVELFHVDGTFNAEQRNEKLGWLKDDTDENICRVLTNARCLSEGVDVPALDAIMFLHPRKSQIDVVQSVGRVMRRAEGKDLGYVILPITVAPGVSAEKALNDNERYKVVWQILNALRAHDERFDSTINRIGLGEDVSDRIEIIDGTSTSELEATTAVVQDVKPKAKKKEEGDEDTDTNLGGEEEIEEEDSKEPEQLSFTLTDLSQAIKAKIVEKCGTRDYWENWASDIAKIAQQHITRINSIVLNSGTKERAAFMQFVEEIRDDLNPEITETDAVEMLAQHIITRPVFDTLFQGNRFTTENAVSKAMETVLTQIYDNKIDTENRTLEKFYESVKRRAADIITSTGRQTLILELYDRFFRNAFPLMTQKLGIVYTPVEVVDFIIHSVEDVMQEEFGSSLGNDGVHILDPFSGTGTFISRLLQSGVMSKDQIRRKFKSEIHANEIVLLAYYIACINIEAVYDDLVKENEYQSFDGMVLTDTFQLYEQDRDMIANLLPDNSERRTKQKQRDITVVIGNPPYSAGQSSANDNAANLSYTNLDAKIEETYAEASTATNKNSLYDSYIRAFRWASQRIGDEGVIGFVTNAGWVDGNATDGFRKCLKEEFNKIYLFHLRGNARTSGELRRKEKGNVFGEGTRTPIVITILVKNDNSTEQGKIYFHDIGDYLDQKQKLAKIAHLGSISSIKNARKFRHLIPDTDNDWINQGVKGYNELTPLISRNKADKPIAEQYFNGVQTNRDVWLVNSSDTKLKQNINTLISTYEIERNKLGGSNSLSKELQANLENSPRKIKWTRGLISLLGKNQEINRNDAEIVTVLYRPFFKQRLMVSKKLNEYPNGWQNRIDNLGAPILAISGPSNKGFSALVTDCIPDVQLIFNGQAIPFYLSNLNKKFDLFDDGKPTENSVNLTHTTQAIYEEKYQQKIQNQVDIFYFIYALFHSPEYLSLFENNLNRDHPRIFLPKQKEDFALFVKLGKLLVDYHVNFETAEKFPITIKQGSLEFAQINNPSEFYYVQKMKPAKKGDKSSVVYNKNITIENIPLEAYEYVVNGKPALEWVMERQCVKTDKASGIVNDANDYANETMNNPAYPLELFQRVITVSLETMKIVKSLPKLDIE